VSPAEPMSAVRVAVIIPCHNDGQLARGSVASTVGPEACEVVVVDDASTDPSSLEALDALRQQGVRVIRHDHNQGLSATRMTGVRETSAPFVFPLDSDDLLVPNALRAMADRLSGDPQLAIAFGDYEEFGERSRIWHVPLTLDAFRVAYRNEYPTSMFRRDILTQVGGWHDVGDLVGYEDWNLLMTLVEQDQRGAHIGAGQVAVRHRIHGNRMLGDAQRHHRELYAHLRRLHPRLFSEIAAHRARTDLPLIQQWLYPILYGGRPPLGLWSHVIAQTTGRVRRVPRQ
jgi:glycosyltransferase involved in cell wall biosynthesis